tara:strand:+ start:3933 stop:4550 length:618 start_codon:yes stop_codon:yes gene_type:complete
MKTTTFTKQQIVEKFVDVELEDAGYNNQDFYLSSENRLRYVLATVELPELYGEQKLPEGTEKNKFYNCIIFPEEGKDFVVKNPELLQQLMDMDNDSLHDYVEDNDYEWLGADFEHIEEYLCFVSDMQDEWQFIAGGTHNDDEYMDIIKQSRNNQRTHNKFKSAIEILISYVPENDYVKQNIYRKLNHQGIDTEFLDGLGLIKEDK